jgi:hypothetical protein
LLRASTPFQADQRTSSPRKKKKDVDGRTKSGHDG